MKHLLNYNDYEILIEEYKTFKSHIKSLNSETPYYVYALCYSNGEPFYIGKGKNLRAFNHLRVCNCSKSVKRVIESLNGEAPIVFIISSNLKESDAIDLEESYITEYGRYAYGGQLANFMPNGTISLSDVAREAGRIGGAATKRGNLGIFSDSYDRGAQTRLNYELGLYNNCDYSKNGIMGGQFVVENQLGFHNPKYDDMRSVWASKAAKQVKNRGGCCSSKWLQNNKDQQLINSSKAGKIGGKINGSMFWWNDGSVNTKSTSSPGEKWVRGMLLSDKKRNSLFGKNKVNITPSKSDEQTKETINE
jgi:hypothetical protein